MRKFLIVTADDFGIHEAVNEAVEIAHRDGVLTTTSLMVGGAAAEDAVRRARSLPDLRIGLHVVLADGFATLATEIIPHLADATGYMNDRMFVNGIRFFASPTVRRQLEAEIRAQFSAYARTGLMLDHVNAHKHFHVHPSLLGMLIRIGAEFNAKAMRVPDEPAWFARTAGWSAWLGNRALRPLMRLMKRRLSSAGIFHNDALFGIDATGSMNEERLLELVARLPAGINEVYLHPAVELDRPIARSMSSYRHADELKALISSRVRAAMDEALIERGGYGDAQRMLRSAS